MEQIKANAYVKEIPPFLKKGYAKKITLSSILLKIYWSPIWIKPFTLMKKKKKTLLYDVMEELPDIRTKQRNNYVHQKQKVTKKKDYTEKAIIELKQLKEEIYHYFYIGRLEQKDYYTNGCSDRSLEYQQEVHRITLSKTNIIPGYMKAYMPELQNDLNQQNLDVTYHFPMNGEVGFITVKTRN